MVFLMKMFKNYSRYLISEDGDIFDKKLGKVIKQQCSKDGYKCVTLRDDNKKRKTFKVHRLVALLFVKNIHNKKEVNHIDGLKTNNNLIKNTKHRVDNIKKANIGRFGKLNPRSISIRCVQTSEIFDSIEIAAKEYNISGTGIGKNLLGKQKSAGKHKIDSTKLTWEYVNG